MAVPAAYAAPGAQVVLLLLLLLLVVVVVVVVLVAAAVVVQRRTYLVLAESGEHGRRQRDERELRALPPVQHDDPVPQVRHERREVLRPSPALEGHVGAQLRDVHGAGVVAAALSAR